MDILTNPCWKMLDDSCQGVLTSLMLDHERIEEKFL